MTTRKYKLLCLVLVLLFALVVYLVSTSAPRPGIKLNVMAKELSVTAKLLLKTMQTHTVLYRAVPNRASYTTQAMGETMVSVRALVELYKKGFIEIESFDKAVAWVVYRIKENKEA